MPATQAGTTNRVSSVLVAFTPRQVLLGSQTMKQSSDNNGSSNGNLPLKLEQKVLLHQSIAKYLQRSGFSKTLKNFLSEAQIEKDNLEGSPVDLEEMCLKYLQIKANINIQNKEQGKHEDKFVADTEDASKKKKKKSDESDSGVIVDQSVAAGTLKDSKNSENEKSYPGAESKAKSKDKNTDNKCKEKKEKKKKKHKLASESLKDNAEGNQLETPPVLPEVKLNNDNDVSDDAKTVTGAETEKKSKDKKKKKKKDKSSGDSLVVEKQEDLENKEKEKKDSKKRKRPISQENDVQPTERQVDEDPKRRKIENKHESNLNSDKENIGKSSQLGGDQLQKTSDEQPNGKINGDIEKFGEKSSMQSSQKKQQGSIEPKTVKAFQRVKVEDIVYADDRLQDNSYWGKDGADYGYGAKAEEVLGQVRGRDFRHEKTKKKRGSYRGGQIDLQSHSIKFNYSDDD